MLIDFLVLAPVLVVHRWADSVSKSAAMALLVPLTYVYVGYSIYYHGRFGQTLGKLFMGIRIVNRNGEAIGWTKAWLRSSLDVLFTALSVVAQFMALAAIADHDYYNVGWMQRYQNLYALRPAWLSWTDTIIEIWSWSEVIVMLFNRERRALHDFIAGTVVIALPKTQDHAA
jgi:uncharacterized RDD family membrane protein YckC